MFTIQYQAIGSYIVFSRKNTLRAAKREAKNLWYYKEKSFRYMEVINKGFGLSFLC
jgi:hypothetical protein